MLSRIYLGAHTVIQVVLGASLSLLWAMICDQKTFRKTITLLTNRHHLLLMSSLMLAISFAYSLFLFILNRNGNRLQSYWKYWSKCPKCKGGFFATSFSNFSLLIFVFGVFLGFALNAARKLPKKALEKKKQNLFTKTVKVLTYFGCMLPWIALFYLRKSIIKIFAEEDSDLDIVITFSLKSISGLGLGISVLYFWPIILRYFSLAEPMCIREPEAKTIEQKNTSE